VCLAADFTVSDRPRDYSKVLVLGTSEPTEETRGMRR